MRRNISSFLLLILLLAGCGPHYHAIKLTKGVHADGEIVSYYAVTRNGVVIPEYVIDEKGEYPITKEEAWSRFEDRKQKLNEAVKNKYVIPANIPYEIQRNIIGAGLLAVSPIFIPIDLLSNLFREKKSGVELSKKNYFEAAFEEPVPKDPRLRDELSQAN